MTDPTWKTQIHDPENIKTIQTRENPCRHFIEHMISGEESHLTKNEEGNAQAGNRRDAPSLQEKTKEREQIRTS